MILSNSYKKAMDKIVLSDELKEKIIKNSSSKKTKQKNNTYLKMYLRNIGGLAACIAFCMLSYYGFTNYNQIPADIGLNSQTAVQAPENTNETDTTNNIPPTVRSSVTEDSSAAVNSSDYKSIQNNIDEPISNADKYDIQENVNYSTNGNISSSNGSAQENNSISAKDNNEITQNTTNDTYETTANEQPYYEQNNLPPTLGNNPNDLLTDEYVNNISENTNTQESNCLAVSPVDSKLSVNDMEQELGYNIKTPDYIPLGYEVNDMAVLYSELAEITYQSKDDKITYRTAKSADDISGDYNSYTNVETVKINNTNVTLKGNGNLYYNAGWTDNNESYSLTSTNGIYKDEMLHIIESVDYSKQNDDEKSTAK